MRRIAILLILLPIALVACRPDPKSEAADLAKKFPEEIGDWEADEDLLELTAENISNIGHVTIIYEGDDDAFAYISIEVYATETAADVAIAEKLRNWQLQGARFAEFELEYEDDNPLDGEEIERAVFPGGVLAYRQSENAVVTLTVIPAEPSEIAEDALFPLLETVVGVVVNSED